MARNASSECVMGRNVGVLALPSHCSVELDMKLVGKLCR